LDPESCRREHFTAVTIPMRLGRGHAAEWIRNVLPTSTPVWEARAFHATIRYHRQKTALAFQEAREASVYRPIALGPQSATIHGLQWPVYAVSNKLV
jgi:hypothetical protein